MKYLLCPDKFKGSLTAGEVCEALADGIRMVDSEAEIRSIPMADGGDGSIELLMDRLALRKEVVPAVDPLGREMHAAYFRSGRTAYVELATASGLVLLKDDERDPLRTSTYGTGLVIRAAIRAGCDEVFLFIGGSATNDAGMGIASALGYRFLDNEGNVVEPVGANLSSVTCIQYDNATELRNAMTLKVVCDVDNPFFGPRGAAYVYAAQKGATKEDIALLDTGLSDFADILVQHGYRDVKEVIGSGAAGGVGGGMFALFNAELASGVGLFFDLFNLSRAIADADMVITGEGKFDHQSFDGKVVGRISEECGRHGKVCIVVCGVNEVSSSEEEPARCEVYSIMDQAGDIEKAFDSALEYLVEIGTRIAKKAASGHDQ